jgi:hypothetical protein
MEHIIAGYLREVWEMSWWLYEVQHGFRLMWKSVSSLDEGVRTGVIIIDFSKAFDLVPHDKLLTKIMATGVDLSVIVWVKEFLLGHLQRIRVDRQLFEEVKITLRVTQGNVLHPLLFLANVNDIWRTTESNIRLLCNIQENNE